MVHIKDNKVVIEVPTLSQMCAVEDWERMTEGLLHLLQTADDEMVDGEERYIMMELLRAMLPEFSPHAE